MMRNREPSVISESAPLAVQQWDRLWRKVGFAGFCLFLLKGLLWVLVPLLLTRLR